MSIPSFLQFKYEIGVLDSNSDKPIAQFDHVYPAYSSFALAHKCLLLSQFLGQRALRYFFGLPDFPEQPNENLVPFGVKSVLHALFEKSAESSPIWNMRK